MLQMLLCTHCPNLEIKHLISLPVSQATVGDYHLNMTTSISRTGVVYHPIFASYDCLWDQTYVENPER